MYKGYALAIGSLEFFYPFQQFNFSILNLSYNSFFSRNGLQVIYFFIDLNKFHFQILKKSIVGWNLKQMSKLTLLLL